MNEIPKYKIPTTRYSLSIAWLYPDLMSTYGDRGNIIVLTKRCEARDIKVTVEQISLDTASKTLATFDLLFMGGAQDKEQEIVNKDLQKEKGKVLQKMIEDNVPGLFVCGAYQFLGKYYQTADNKKLPGLGVFDIHTIHSGDNSQRLIGNIVVKPTLNTKYNIQDTVFVGFENHGGRTYLGKNVEPFAKVIKGFGNNGEDGTEGMIYKNAIGTYLHGPILPKNPELADYLIEKALTKKYGEIEPLETLEDSFAKKAREVVANKN